MKTDYDVIVAGGGIAGVLTATSIAINSKEKLIIGISPEGTRTLSGQLGEFKKGPFHIALNTGVTIVPVALMGAYEAKKKTDWRLSPGILTICFGEPVTADQYKSMDIDILRAHIREKIQQLIDNKRKGK